MAEKKASLTVLGGALAGTRFVLEGVGPEVLLGADPSCPFQLALPGVSPSHARVRIDGNGFTIEDAGSEQGLHVNDSRVDAATPLRNGDIVWLGTPGEADVVMLQCILPARPVAAAAMAPAAPPPAPEPEPEPESESESEPALSEDETLALALESEGGAHRAEATEHEHEPATAFYTADEAAAARGAYDGGEVADENVPFASDPGSAEPELVVAEDETVAQSVPFVVDSPPAGAPSAPAHFEDDTREQTYVFEEESATVVMAGNDPSAVASVYSDTGFMVEESATVVMGSEPEPTMALPPPPSPPAPVPLTVAAPRLPLAPTPTPAPPPAAARPRPAAGSAPAPAARKPAPRPQPAPPAEAEDEAPVGRPSPPVALYAGLGAVALAVLGGGAYFVLGRKGTAPPTTLAQAPPVTAASAPPRTLAPAPPITEAPQPVTIEPEATPAPVAATPPPTTLKPGPSPLPTPTPAAKKAAPTPTPAATPAGPSPEQLRAQQIASLMGQAEAALGAGQYDQAIGHLDEVLRLEPGNSGATGDRASAVSLRDATRKKFVAGRTVVKTEKASGGLAGFEGAEVQRQPDFSGRIEFEMSPASGLKPGDAWTLKIYLVNDGKKAIKVGGVTASTVVNGSGAGGAVPAAVKEVAPQQRTLLGQSTGSWKDGTSTWVADVLVTANKGDSLKNTLTWR